MEPAQKPVSNFFSSNRILLKGIVTGILILFMLVPTAFIFSLVYERKQRQHEIVEEVSSKWSSAQTLTGPYLFVPYGSIIKNKEGKPEEIKSHFWIIPENLNVNGNIDHHVRRRSIYKVLLYSASFTHKGNFILKIPSEVDSNSIHWNEAKICFGLSDFRGIEERIMIRFNGRNLEFTPGLPFNDINSKGLSVPADLTNNGYGKMIPFDMKLKLKGSEQLNFIPLSGNSEFALRSAWPDPSFNGSTLPGERNVTDSGFTAKWTFNKANLPFGTVLNDFKAADLNLEFGVTMLQPADQYAKTERSVKYAILFIGLTFALFFIVEIMQNKPVHPVQYILIGLALVIFYSLLLSLSEVLPFDAAYLISALAIISMITLYARSHFRSWMPASLFGGILSLLYIFIFILIHLEDTALLVGSIGLFIVLALVMYASGKINWYGAAPQTENVVI